MKKRLTALMLLPALLLVGCGGRGSIYSSYREIEHLLPVQTLGLDRSPQGLRLSVSFAQSGQGSDPGIISREGGSISQAMNSLQDYSAAGQLYYSHTQNVLLGEDYARQGLSPLLDYLARDGRMRLGVQLFVVRGGSAAELVTGPGEGSYDISGALSALSRDSKTQGSCPPFTCRETIRSLSESGAALVCAVAQADTSGSVFLAPESSTARASGYAIIKDGALADFMDAELCPAASLLLGRAGTAAPELELADGCRVSLSMDSARARIEPLWTEQDGCVRIRISAELSAGGAELHGGGRVTDRESLEQLERLLEQDTEEKLRRVLELAVGLDADFLGLMAHLRQSDAKKADALPEDWLRRAEFLISVEARLLDLGDMGERMNEDGWGN